MLAHEHLVRGDAKKAIENSKYVVTKEYRTPFTEHAFLEPECSVAIVDREKERGSDLFVRPGNVAIRSANAPECWAGSFPGSMSSTNWWAAASAAKEDMAVQHHAALLAHHTGKPVKVRLTKESIMIHPKRHPAWMEFTTACDENGYLTGMAAKVITDTGAYASLGRARCFRGSVPMRQAPITYQNIDIDGTAVYTNNPPAGAFRGFGVTRAALLRSAT